MPFELRIHTEIVFGNCKQSSSNKCLYGDSLGHILIINSNYTKPFVSMTANNIA